MSAISRPAWQHDDEPGARVHAGVPQIVIVATSCDRFADFVHAARAGDIGLHVCINGHSALRLAGRFPADAWIVAADLPDMSGFDLVEMLATRVLQGDVDRPRAGSRSCPDQGGESLHAAIFIVADDYRIDDEQRALAAGVAGFFVHPLTPDMIGDSLQHAPSRGRVTTASGAS